MKSDIKLERYDNSMVAARGKGVGSSKGYWGSNTEDLTLVGWHTMQYKDDVS